MKVFIHAMIGVAIAMSTAASPAQAGPVQEANKKLVSNAMHELFVTRNAEKAVRLYFGSPYLQHNPTIPDGADDLPAVIKSLPANFKYEPGVIVADGDLVMIHGRYTGGRVGQPPQIIADIFRIADGLLVEHWDVVADEIPREKTVSGNAMFTNPQATLQPLSA